MSDLISRQVAIDALDVLCQEHRYKIPGKAETYSQYNEAWQDALDRAEGAIGNLPSAQPEIIRCKDCKYYLLGHDDLFYCFKHADDILWQDDSFCSCAERKK